MRATSASTSRSSSKFAHFVGTAVQGEFGLSLRQGRKVSALIAERFPATLLELSLAAAVIALAFGIPGSASTRRCGAAASAPS